MRRKIVIMLINLGLGLFTVSMFLISARETHISETRDNITCDIIKLDLEYSSRQHPSSPAVQLRALCSGGPLGVFFRWRGS